MITNIIEYDIKDEEKIKFKDIDKVDLNAWILWGNSPNGLYELSDKINMENINNIELKYGIRFIPDNSWTPKIKKIIESFDKESKLKLIKYSKELFISKFGNEYGLRAYKNYLFGSIIKNEIIYNTFIRNDEEVKDFLYKELKEIIKYYHDREYKVGFVIDELYGYPCSWNNEKFDNGGETDRYNYWRKYKEEGKCLIIN